MEFRDAEIPAEVLPSAQVIAQARNAIHTSLPSTGLGTTATEHHLHDDITPGLNANSKSSRYYGFVTGGTTPAAKAADNIVTDYDQNVQVHLPEETIATNVEFHALRMLCQLLDLEPREWGHRIFTTGATGSNFQGLACGREYVINRAGASVAALGLVKAMRVAEVDEIQVLTTIAHSSIKKAASIVGLGHDCVKDCSQADVPYRFDMEKLAQLMELPRTATIIMVSCCEVNSGMFATQCRRDMEDLRSLADRYGAWIHVDAAMGFMARLLPADEEFGRIRRWSEGLELADSITGDGHKLLNVPYDCGFFLSRHLGIGTQVFQNPNAAYLSSSASSIPSPLNVGLENSRRFRALPVYANLVAYGRSGYTDMIERQIRMARQIAEYLFDSEDYEVYQPGTEMSKSELLSTVFMIVLFRAKDDAVNESLVKNINGTRKVYCSGTQWQNKPAVRFAISNWKCDVERDWPVVKEVLDVIVKK